MKCYGPPARQLTANPEAVTTWTLPADEDAGQKIAIPRLANWHLESIRLLNSHGAAEAAEDDERIVSLKRRRPSSRSWQLMLFVTIRCKRTSGLFTRLLCPFFASDIGRGLTHWNIFIISAESMVDLDLPIRLPLG